ncbi:hypothetical protein CB1_000394001 [Camelus ferus]|nr:hypothetical protein CB1_000394001 [Camelus ferus]
MTLQALAQVDVFKASDHPSLLLHVLSQLAINSDLCCSSQDLAFILQCLVPDLLRPQRLSRQLVCPERVICSDLGVSGAVHVCNMALEKQVAVHYTFLDWCSLDEAMARWHSPWRRGHLGCLRLRLPCAALPAAVQLPPALCTALQGGQRRVLGQQPRR